MMRSLVNGTGQNHHPGATLPLAEAEGKRLRLIARTGWGLASPRPTCAGPLSWSRRLFTRMLTSTSRRLWKARSRARKSLWGASLTLRIFMGWQLRPVMDARLRNGASVWVRLDVFRRTADNPRGRYVQAIGRELSSDRIVLAGIGTAPGQGHIVTVIGAAHPINTRRLISTEMLGFLVYDPLTAKPYLVSIKELYKNLN